MVKELDMNNFLSEVGDAKFAVVDFWAEWCQPCRQMSPLLSEIEGEIGSKFSFFKVNVDKASDIASQYGIQSIPTLLIFKKGKPITSMIGLLPKSLIKKELENTIRGPSVL